MDRKLLQSKINLLEAQLKQYNESGLFTDKEIAAFSLPSKTALAELYQELNGDAGNVDVNQSEILS